MSVSNTHYGNAVIEKMLDKCKSVFFIGIGGVNMSSLALITLKRGYAVGGSDRACSDVTVNLSKQGIKVHYCHAADNIKGYDAVVYTVAISNDNPEYVAAMQLGIPCISRADYLGYIMTAYNRRIGISGMHGKSTCTAMVSQILIENNNNPTVMCGASVPIMHGASYIGDGQEFVFEACEYMDSFLDFYPNIAVILNIEAEHLDYFRNVAHIRSSYAAFANKCGSDGCIIANSDDDNVTKILKKISGHKLTFGLSADASVRAEICGCHDGFYSFDLIIKDEFICRVSLSVTGIYNVYNALAASAVAYSVGVSGEVIAAALSHFKGAGRRMEYKGKYMNALVFDDYAHHPTEIKATLNGAKNIPGGRLFCVFQPHTYSRVYSFFDEICSALSVADRVILADIYAARETDTLGMSSSLIAETIGNKAAYGKTLEEIAELLKKELVDGDKLVVMGAGDIYELFDILRLNNKVLDKM